MGSHSKEPVKKHLKKSLLIRIIIAELLLVFAASYFTLYISMDHINHRRASNVGICLASFDTAPITENMDANIALAKESVAETMDENVWTTASVNYRIGPDTTYESAGVLNQYASVKRVGVTFNEWSQVEIGDQTYYIRSDFLSNEAPMVTAGGAKGDYQRYALSILGNYGWADTEIYPLIKLWDRESGWNPNAHNSSSGAHGIAQALPASKMASEGSDYYTNGNTQIRWGLSYIKGRYGSPSNAWAHFCSHNWY